MLVTNLIFLAYQEYQTYACLLMAGIGMHSHNAGAGFKSRQILCMPVVGTVGDSIGAIQIINTSDGLPFGTRELELLRAFIPFVRASILNDKRQFAKLLIAKPCELMKMSAFKQDKLPRL